jgi:hypothetical protein
VGRREDGDQFIGFLAERLDVVQLTVVIGQILEQ